MRDIQYNAIDKYGTKFTTKTFYKKIAQNKTYIHRINEKLKKYKLFVDYFPRKKYDLNKWLISDIYLEIYS